MGIAIPMLDQNIIKIDSGGPFVVGDICDWISVSQEHDHELFQPSKTHYLIIDTGTGEVQETKHNAVFVEGSFSTHIRVQVNGSRVSLSGNVGRFGRPENCFGHSLDKVKLLANEFITQLGLPPFSAGCVNRLETRNGSVNAYTGAKISRIDICTNYKTGEHCKRIIDALSARHVSRTKSRTYGESETVSWGTTLKTTKVYNKAAELERHNKDKLSYTRDLINWCNEVGILRHETKFQEKYLNRKGLKPWAKCTSETIKQHYDETKKILEDAMEFNEIDDLPIYLVGTYYAYINGVDMNKLSKSTFYRHRKELLKFGIDIASKHNVTALKPKTKIVYLGTPEIPEFYNRLTA